MLRQAHFTHIHSGGRAAGTAETDTGAKTIYADNAIPGEEAEVEIMRRQRGFRQAVVRRLLKASPDRITPFCPHASICGGCNWQHMAYPAQRYWKRQILIDALAKYEIETPPVPDVAPSPLQQGYRNKSEYAFASQPEPIFGFHPKEEAHKIFECDTCFLQPPRVHLMAKKVFELTKGLPLQYLQIRTTTLGDTCCIFGFAAQQYVVGSARLTEKIDSIAFEYGPFSFFQPNPLQAVALYRQIKRYAGLSGSETVYDLYTGIGSIACYIADGAKEVIGIEGNPAAVLDAKENAKINGMAHVRFIAGDILETFTSDFVDRNPKADLIILDPPRSGTLIEIKKAILYAAPQKIIYVSCNPVSLAWDLKQLCAGGYRVTALQPFDMFPHTHHVETVCLLEK